MLPFINNPNGWILGCGPLARALIKTIHQVASKQCSVLITGPTGSGKEIVARLIHSSGPRADKPFVAVNCPATPDTLVEGAFFGHKKGSFTGATDDRKGHLISADTGILFLDEIGEMPLAAQPKLLRALEAREVTRVGESSAQSVDIQVVTATNRDLLQEIDRGQFRSDLYYRLCTITIEVPALRDRVEDIPDLVMHFVTKFAAKYSSPPRERSEIDFDRLRQYPWPGNIRELSHVVEAAIVREAPILPPEIHQTATQLPTLNRHELLKLAAAAAFRKAGGNLTLAARYFGSTYKTLLKYLPAHQVRHRQQAALVTGHEPSLNGHSEHASAT